jgi:hypothetical protein
VFRPERAEDPGALSGRHINRLRTQGVALDWHTSALSAPRSKILFERRKTFFQLRKLHLPFGERRFEPLYDMIWGAAAKRLVFQALLFRRNIFRQAIYVLAELFDLSGIVGGCSVLSEMVYVVPA